MFWIFSNRARVLKKTGVRAEGGGGGGVKIATDRSEIVGGGRGSLHFVT